LEPYREAANYSRLKHKLNIIDGVLPIPTTPDGHFDAVIMLHVIEHMPDPAESIREIRRLLKPGGVLAVETPRFNSLMFKILKHRERSIQNCQGHIFFFTEDTLSKLLEKHGFKVFRIDRVGRTLTLDRLAYNVALISKSAALQRLLSGTSKRLRWDRIRVHVNARDMQRIFARAV
jgi:SAM-dependent methyltransferase